MSPFGLPQTMGGIGPAPPPDDANQQMLVLMQALAAKQAEAQSGADQAGQQYQQAAEAPNPGLNPFAALAGGLLPDLASIVSGNKEYGQRGHQQVKQAQADLMQKRADNLTALAAAYETKSKAAKEIGNKAMELEFEEKKGKIQKQHETILKTMEQDRLDSREAAGNASAERREAAGNTNELAVQRLRNQGGLAEAQVRAATSNEQASTEDVATFGRSVVAKQSDLANYSEPVRKQIVRWVEANGKAILPQKAHDTLGVLRNAKSTLERLKKLSESVHTSTDKNRVQVGVKNWLDAKTQKAGKEALSLYDSRKKGFLSELARAVGEKGNLSNKDIERAGALYPDFFATKAVADQGWADLEQWIEERKIGEIQSYATEPTGGSGVQSGSSSSATGGGGDVVYKAVGGKMVPQ